MASSPDLHATVQQAFTEHFGTQPTHISRAPGRINVIGEHTDYNDGFVLPAAIDRAIYIAGKVRRDNTVGVQSLDYHGATTFTLGQLRDESLPEWTRFLRGALWVLQEEGHKLRGMDLTIAGNVPGGAGFSSSAAVEVAMFEVASALLGIQLTQKQKALLGVQVEHKFIGIRTGVMDQMISALGQADHALLIDCRSLATSAVPIPSGVTLVALDTGKRRQLVESEYGKRREQCEEAARILGVKALRDVTPEQLAAQADKLPEVIAQRASHVVNENARTLAAVDALRYGDLVKVGRLINESHTSLRDLYEVSIHELDVMAELAQRTEGCYGARMMGGGFGGAVIALVQDSAVAHLTDVVAGAYNAATHLQAYIYALKAGPGSSVAQVG
ncbi:MAG: galactokinase [Anaerolineae bacterium]|nr:galactokinase [Anaerolineae bacterium]